MNIDSSGSSELRQAAAAILEELTALAGTVPNRIAGMLLYIRDHLFDPELSVAVVKERCAVRDNSVAIHFHSMLGEPPAAFITSRRLTVADRLLAETHLPIWKVTELLGYSSIQVFSRAYSRRKGIRPREFRRQIHSEAPPASPAVQASFPPGPQELLAKALAGQLSSIEASRLIRRLLEIYPPGRRLAAGEEELDGRVNGAQAP